MLTLNDKCSQRVGEQIGFPEGRWSEDAFPLPQVGKNG